MAEGALDEFLLLLLDDVAVDRQGQVTDDEGHQRGDEFEPQAGMGKTEESDGRVENDESQNHPGPRQHTHARHGH